MYIYAHCIRARPQEISRISLCTCLSPTSSREDFDHGVEDEYWHTSFLLVSAGVRLRRPQWEVPTFTTPTSARNRGFTPSRGSIVAPPHSASDRVHRLRLGCDRNRACRRRDRSTVVFFIDSSYAGNGIRTWRANQDPASILPR